MNYNNLGNKSIVSTKVMLIIALVFFSLIFGSLFICTPVEAQTFKKSIKVLKDTVIKEVKYTMYQGVRGGRYIVKNAKAGGTYKVYFRTIKK